MDEIQWQDTAKEYVVLVDGDGNEFRTKKSFAREYIMDREEVPILRTAD